MAGRRRKTTSGGAAPDTHAIETLRAEITAGLAQGTIEIKPFYWDLRSRVIRPWETVQTTRYFWYKWRPVLGPTYTLLLMDLRILAAEALEHGPTQALSVTQDELARRAGLSRPTVERHLSPSAFKDSKRWFLSKFVKPYHRYEYNEEKRRKVRAPNGYEVALDDPLLPEDEERLRGLYAEQEIQELLRQGVVDFTRYAELRGQAASIHQSVPPIHQSAEQTPGARTNPQIEGKGNFPDIAGLGDPQIKLMEQKIAVEDKRVPTSTDQAFPQSDRADEQLTARLLKTFAGKLSRKKARALIAECGIEEVARQLTWFPHRDNRWAEKGPVAAFVYYCESGSPEPEEYRRSKETERRRREAKKEEELKARYENYLEAQTERAKRDMGAKQWSRLEDKVRSELKSRFSLDGEESSFFDAAMGSRIRAILMEEGRVMGFEEWKRGHAR